MSMELEKAIAGRALVNNRYYEEGTKMDKRGFMRPIPLRSNKVLGISLSSEDPKAILEAAKYSVMRNWNKYYNSLDRYNNYLRDPELVDKKAERNAGAPRRFIEKLIRTNVR